MATVVLDGRAVTVKPGRTVLEACRENCVPLPTLCYLDGVSEASSCRLCAVEVRGFPRPVPTCSTRVVEGAVISGPHHQLARPARWLSARWRSRSRSR